MRNFNRIPDSLIYTDTRAYYGAKIKNADGLIEFDNEDKPKIIAYSPLENKNNTAQIIKDYKRYGLIKNCSNIYIEGASLYNDFCYPVCKQQSLNYEFYGKGKVLIGCSKSCHYFIPSWQTTLINFTKKFYLSIKQLAIIIFRGWIEQH